MIVFTQSSETFKIEIVVAPDKDKYFAQSVLIPLPVIEYNRNNKGDIYTNWFADFRAAVNTMVNVVVSQVNWALADQYYELLALVVKGRDYQEQIRLVQEIEELCRLGQSALQFFADNYQALPSGQFENFRFEPLPEEIVKALMSGRDDPEVKIEIGKKYHEASQYLIFAE